MRGVQERRPGRTPLNERQLTVLRAWLVIIAIACAVVVLDQLAKTWALGRLAGDEVIDLPLGTTLHLVYNRGIAFGLGEGWAPILVVFALTTMIVVLLAKRVVLTGPSVFGVAIVLGGALGNLCDRLFRDAGGAVIDFVDVGWWPVFNLADACIVVGALILVLCASRKNEVT